jgi:hypothetical protein
MTLHFFADLMVSPSVYDVAGGLLLSFATGATGYLGRAAMAKAVRWLRERFKSEK